MVMNVGILSLCQDQMNLGRDEKVEFCPHYNLLHTHNQEK
jgi:hypothetical protein